MKYLALLFLCAGCNTFNSHIQEICPDGTIRTTEITIRNMFDSKSELAKLKTTFTDKTQGISVGSLSQESSSSNLVTTVEAVATGVAKAFIKP